MKTTFHKHFFFGMSLFLFLLVILGFWPSYFSPFLQKKEIFSSVPLGVIHVHAAAFLGWFLFLIVQSFLTKMRKLKIHMLLGRSTAFWGLVVVTTGLVVVIWSTYNGISGGHIKTIYPIIGQVGVGLQVIFFGFFLYRAYKQRFQADYHKRYVLLASLSIMPAATDRMLYILGMWSLELMLLIFILSLVVHDLLTIGHIHKANKVGILLLFLSTFLISFGFKISFLLFN